MNDHEPPIDDELVSAVLDGEATPHERALVEGSDAGRRRLEELREVRALVRQPVDPLRADLVDRLVGRALAAERAAPAASPGPGSITDLGAVRSRSSAPRHRRWGPAVAAAAAVVVVVGGIVALAGSAGHDSASDDASSTSDTASVYEQGASAADQVAPERAGGGENSSDGAASSSASPPLDLGEQADPDAALDAYQGVASTYLSDSRRFEQQFVPGRASRCPADLAAVAPGPWSVVATATVSGRPLTVVAAGDPSSITRLIVVDEVDCTVLADRPG
jgi:negative regulator of sigma E activity